MSDQDVDIVRIFFIGIEKKVPDKTAHGINIFSEVPDEEVFMAK